jgi:hypothetical protein
MALYAGESVGAVTGVQSAGEVVRELAEGAERLLRVWAQPSAPCPGFRRRDEGAMCAVSVTVVHAGHR